MKKERDIVTIALLLLILASGAICYAGLSDVSGSKQRDARANPVQFFAPDGGKTQKLTVNKTAIDMSGSVVYATYGTSACISYLSATSTASGTASQIPASTASTAVVRGVNSTTPFIVYSGCTNNIHERE